MCIPGRYAGIMTLILNQEVLFDVSHRPVECGGWSIHILQPQDKRAPRQGKGTAMPFFVHAHASFSL